MANGAVANGARDTGGVSSTSSTREKLNSDRQEVSSGLTTNDIISAVTFLDNPLNMQNVIGNIKNCERIYKERKQVFSN